eukprot:1036297-Prymnesium_polylepis.1
MKQQRAHDRSTRLPHGETHTSQTNEIVKCPGRPHAPDTPTLCAAARIAPDRAPDRPQSL